jgi:hypothetical protein
MPLSLLSLLLGSFYWFEHGKCVSIIEKEEERRKTFLPLLEFNIYMEFYRIHLKNGSKSTRKIRSQKSHCLGTFLSSTPRAAAKIELEVCLYLHGFCL